VHAREMVSGPDHDAKNNERHVCGRRRDGEPAVSSMLTSLHIEKQPSVSLGSVVLVVADEEQKSNKKKTAGGRLG
jgi:hypothetical protein